MQLRQAVSLIVLLFALTTPSMATDPAMEPVTATFSIAAFDPLTREWGVGVASRVLAVGYIVPWARAEPA
ncbi:DUF1028 domain-containing protein [bacterium]|nr:DUF1028 domain-containing protein [bacterium]